MSIDDVLKMNIGEFALWKGWCDRHPPSEVILSLLTKIVSMIFSGKGGVPNSLFGNWLETSEARNEKENNEALAMLRSISESL